MGVACLAQVAAGAVAVAFTLVALTPAVLLAAVVRDATPSAH